MVFVVIGRDKADPGLRKAARADHLEFVSSRQDGVIYAGPLFEAGRIVGSLFVFDLSDRAELDARLAQDPYFTRGVFGTVEVFESKWMVPEQAPGALREEIEQARRDAQQGNP